jgi:hypothetical protein
MSMMQIRGLFVLASKLLFYELQFDIIYNLALLTKQGAWQTSA